MEFWNETCILNTAFCLPPPLTHPITLPGNISKILLHSCCATCSGSVIEQLVQSGADVTVLFYNPNIHPKKEYEKRKAECIRICKKMGARCIDADYNPEQWFQETEGLENEPERGARCTACFDLRLSKAAEFASKNDFPYFTSCLGISRWKDMEQVNACGRRAGKRYDVEYWDYNWRKKGGSRRMVEIAKEEELYTQKYCGCVHSLRDSHRAT